MAVSERDATGVAKMGRSGDDKGLGPAGKVDLALPDIKKVTSDINDLNEAIKKLHATLGKPSIAGMVKGWASNIDGAVSKLIGKMSGSGGPGKGGPQVGQTAFQAGSVDPNTVKVATTPPVSTSTAPRVDMSTPSGPTSTPAPNLPRDGGPASADISSSAKTGKLVESAGKWGENHGGIMDLITGGLPFQMAKLIYGAVAGGGLQYVYNRINGPSGNMNSMLQASQALGPHVTMMNATGQYAGNGPFTIRKTLAGLANEYPVLGSEQDVLSTVMAGTGIGALLRGTESRNGFYKAARQMQILNPGQSPGTIANSLAGYISNTQSQQRGLFYGQGAFTMFGQGGSYKTLAQWAEGIKKFLEQQRGGGSQGKPLTRAELVTQNFPGSNINAWFQMMGVPQNMVDYWWQYVLTNTSATDSSGKTLNLEEAVRADRGYNLGYERLRNIGAGTQREFKFGSEMYKPYLARESADRRFNQKMGQVDLALGQMIKGSDIGALLSMMPTPLMEFLLPILSGIATSPIGAIASTVGHTVDKLGGIVGDPDPYGDPMPFGDMGSHGSTTTSHLSPDLAKRVQAMMKANPNLRISSSYRDTHTQNRLRRQGGPVARPSRSAHTRGWAADIGPMSQAGWLAANAHKFGLQTAENKGEPWHIQLAGSMPYGDVMPYGDDETDYVGNGIKANRVEDLGALSALTSLVKLLNIFTGTLSANTLMDATDAGTSIWSQLMLAPFSGFLKLGGRSNIFKGSQSELDALMQSDAKGVTNIGVPSVFSGFQAEKTIAYKNPFDRWYGDPDDLPYGDPMSMMSGASSRQNVIKPVIFQNQITVNTTGSMTSTAAKAAASAIADHLESEVSRRQWSVV